MKMVLVFPLVCIMYMFLLLTSYTSRIMSVASAIIAAACVNVILWSGSSWLISKIKLKDEK